ncbi:MAG: nucleotide sugar dehydrogenase [Alphaproteobacteria bacterium]|nr:nucleotide sugar dehydrogenase [Alphaproteobacteria bacterium]
MSGHSIVERNPATQVASQATGAETGPEIDRLVALYADRKATVGVVGLGYVGLPLVKALSARGFRTIGFDIDRRKVDQLNAGKSYIRHIPSELVADIVAGGRFLATADFSRIKDADAILICVPTPLTRQREPDMTYVIGTTEQIAPYLRRGQLIVLESTTYPGTTTEIMKPILERGGLRSQRDFFIAYSPEREDPGNPNYETSTIPKVVGGDGDAATRMAAALYSQVVAGVVTVSSAATAEAVKLTENIFRAVNIALVNELKVVFARMGIDIWEVIDAAKSKPFGYMPFYPGPGLGGHCIPIDPFYLTWKAREYDTPTRFIELAGEVNVSMPAYVVQQLAQEIDRRFSKGLNGARILMLGVAYKKNVEDIRESPAFKLMHQLEERGARVDYYDPFVAEIPVTREHPEYGGRRSVDWNPAAFGKYDACLICTDHDGVDYDALVKAARLVVDTRNATGKVTEDRDKIVKA